VTGVQTCALPILLTATKVPFPYVTEFQVFASVAVRAVQVVPSA
jgi:hypothetical protein